MVLAVKVNYIVTGFYQFFQNNHYIYILLYISLQNAITTSLDKCKIFLALFEPQKTIFKLSEDKVYPGCRIKMRVMDRPEWQGIPLKCKYIFWKIIQYLQENAALLSSYSISYFISESTKFKKSQIIFSIQTCLKKQAYDNCTIVKKNILFRPNFEIKSDLKGQYFPQDKSYLNPLKTYITFINPKTCQLV